ncbi:MAG: TetR/AcrR family transcriptional regulator [Oscillospiraceae bacterium]|nr:TetR/AcrR family transcriptional regulator [Oscillospiraceae bacterium]
MGKRQIGAMQTRLKIITAAEKLIKERGFENVTIDEIAAEAGVAKGSFYTYFKCKKDVVGEIAKSNFIEMQKKSMEIPGDVCDRLASFLCDSMRYIVETGVKISQQWIKNVVEPENEGGKNKLLYDKSVLKEILSQAVDQGELAKETPVENLTEYIVAEYYGIVFCWNLLDGAFDPTDLIENYCHGQLNDSLEKYRSKTAIGSEE